MCQGEYPGYYPSTTRFSADNFDQNSDIDRTVNVPAANEDLMMRAVATGPVVVRLSSSASSFALYICGIIEGGISLAKERKMFTSAV